MGGRHVSRRRPRGPFRRNRLANITAFTIRYNKTARPCKCSYDADADHARYLERHRQPEPETLGTRTSQGITMCHTMQWGLWEGRRQRSQAPVRRTGSRLNDLQDALGPSARMI
jgi:hypothetical protein